RGVEHHEILTLALDREVPVRRGGLEPALLLRLALQPAPPGLELLPDQLLVLLAAPARAPVQPVQRLEIDALEHAGERHRPGWRHAASPERRRRDRHPAVHLHLEIPLPR